MGLLDDNLDLIDLEIENFFGVIYWNLSNLYYLYYDYYDYGYLLYCDYYMLNWYFECFDLKNFYYYLLICLNICFEMLKC